MAQLVVHIRKEGAARTEPAYAVFVSDKIVSVQPFGPQWQEAANSMQAMLSSRCPGGRVVPQVSPMAQPMELPH